MGPDREKCAAASKAHRLHAQSRAEGTKKKAPPHLGPSRGGGENSGPEEEKHQSPREQGGTEVFANGNQAADHFCKRRRCGIRSVRKPRGRTARKRNFKTDIDEKGSDARKCSSSCLKIKRGKGRRWGGGGGIGEGGKKKMDSQGEGKRGQDKGLRESDAVQCFLFELVRILPLTAKLFIKRLRTFKKRAEKAFSVFKIKERLSSTLNQN